MKSRLVAACVVVAALTRCAPAHNWQPGPQVAVSDFERDKARCDFLARHSGGGGFAIGGPAFLIGYAVGNAIASTNRVQSDFNDCMIDRGWEVAP